MRTESLEEHVVWTLGEEVVAGPADRTICGRGDFTERIVTGIGVEGYGRPLSARPDEPPERHAVVVGWPPVEDSEARKSFAQQLRDQSSPHPYPRLAIR